MLAARSTRSRLVQAFGCPSRSIGSIWDKVLSPMWHPLAAMEQSLMDVDRITSHMFSRQYPPWPQTLLPPRVSFEEDDFFRDLTTKPSQSETKLKSKKPIEASKDESAVNEALKDPQHSYSSYSYSYSSVIGNDGHRVGTLRRRYEDSTGRLKAIHEREVDGKKVIDIWQRHAPDDKGEHKSICTGSSTEEFEREWKNTPFGQAEEQRKKQEKAEQVLESSGTDPNAAVKAADAAADMAPEKECGKEAQGVTKESKEMTREEAIAQGFRTQEEETTPLTYS